MTNLALETVRYAAECVRFGERELAIGAIRDSGSLSSEQQQAMEKIIQELGAGPHTVREECYFENRLMGVIQPATWEFVHDEKLMASVISYIHCGSISLAADYAIPLVQTSHFRMNQWLLRDCMATRADVSSWGMSKHQEQLRDLDNPDKSLSAVEFVPFYPQLTTFTLYARKPENLQEIADAIKRHCPHFKTLDVRIPATNFQTLLDPFKPYLESMAWDFQTGICSIKLFEYFQTFPHLTELILNKMLDQDVYDEPKVFEKFTGLKKLSIVIEKRGNYKTLIDSLSKLPLISLNIADSYELRDAELLPFAQMPNLEEIDIRQVPFTVAGIRRFILAKKGPLKRIVIEPLEYQPNFFLREIHLLQAEFPNIAFVNREGKVYQTPTKTK